MIYLDNNTFQQEIFIPRSSAKNDASPDYATRTELENAIENEVIRADGKYATKTDLLPYATTGWVESQDYVNSDETSSAITDAMASETARTEETYQKISEMSAYSTTNEVESMIDDAVSGKMDTSAMSAYTPTSGFSTINGSAITEGGNIVIQGGGAEYSAGTNIEITDDNVINVTGITVPTKVSELQNDSGYITTADTQNFVTSGDVKTQIEGYDFVNSGDVQTQINESISGKADSSAVTAQISEVKQEIEAEIPSKVSDLQNDLNFASTGDVESMISGFTTSADVQTQIESYNYINSGQAQTQIDNSISGKVDTSALTQYYTSAQTDTAIDNAVSGKVDSSRVDEIEEVTASALTDLKTTKLDSTALTQYYTSAQTDTAIDNATSGLQETLVSGTNIKTINNESILGSGNIVISGGSGSANIIELTQAEYDALTAYTEDAMYVITDAQEINMDNYATTGDFGSYYTSAQTDTAISNAVSGKTDKVSVTASSSGYKFPTWNNQGCITGTSATAYQASHNINGSSRNVYSNSSSALPTIYAPTTAGSAGQPLLSNGSGSPVWANIKFRFLSQSEYDNLGTYDSSCIYFIISEL